MNEPVLSAFQQSMRDAEELFNRTFPETKLVRLQQSLEEDATFVYYPGQQEYYDSQLEYQHAQDAGYLHYDYVSAPPQHQQQQHQQHQPEYYTPLATNEQYWQTNSQVVPVVASPIEQYPFEGGYAQYHDVPTPVPFASTALTPVPFTSTSSSDAHNAVPTQPPLYVPSNYSLAGAQVPQGLGEYSAAPVEPPSRPPRPNRPRHHETAPYPQRSYTYEHVPSVPSRHSRSLSQGGGAAPHRMPVRALSASASSTVWQHEAHNGSMAAPAIGAKTPYPIGTSRADAITEASVSRPSMSPASMRLSPLPSNKRPLERKPPLACLFCRGRKIACGPPLPGSLDKTCNQCQRRQLACEYPSESRRGMRKKKVEDPAGGSKDAISSSSVSLPTGKPLM